MFLGCSEIDAHIPLSLVQETSQTFRALGAVLVERIYPGLDHTINDDEIRQVRGMPADLPQVTSRPQQKG